MIKEEKQLIYDSLKAKTLNTLAKDHLLISRDNVVFTPHIGFYSREALERIILMTVENIVHFGTGKQDSSAIVC